MGKAKDPSILNEPAYAVEIILKGEKPSVRLLSVEKVLGGRVHDKESLLYELVKRQHNSLNFHHSDITSRRWHLEYERPALRFYCKHYGVPVPGWLEGCGGYEDCSEETFTRLFGTRPLHPVEFKTWGGLFPELKPQ
jgi:hypothetical protein